MREESEELPRRREADEIRQYFKLVASPARDEIIDYSGDCVEDDFL